MLWRRRINSSLLFQGFVTNTYDFPYFVRKTVGERSKLDLDTFRAVHSLSHRLGIVFTKRCVVSRRNLVIINIVYQVPGSRDAGIPSSHQESYKLSRNVFVLSNHFVRLVAGTKTLMLLLPLLSVMENGTLRTAVEYAIKEPLVKGQHRRTVLSSVPLLSQIGYNVGFSVGRTRGDKLI